MSRVLLVMVVVGCGGAPPARPAPPAAPARDLAVAEPLRTPEPPPRAAIYPPLSPIGQLPYWKREVGIPIEAQGYPELERRGVADLLEVASRKSDNWPPCVRDFVAMIPAGARNALGDALARCDTTCGGGKLVFRPAHHDGSYAGLAGTLTRTWRDVALEVGYAGSAIDPDHITLIADGARWTSPRLDFEAQPGLHVASLPLTHDVARALHRVLDATDAVLRFESAKGFEDVVVTDELRAELRAIIEAIEAL